MRKTSRETVPSHTIIVNVEVACDLCKRAAPYPRNIRPWAKDSFDCTEVKMEMTSGKVFPEGGSTSTESFDVCPACWEGKVKPAMAALGAGSLWEEEVDH